MRRFARILGSLAMTGGACLLLWVGAVWLWQDPFTALYTKYEQRQLAQQYDDRVGEFRLHVGGSQNLSPRATRALLATEARTYRRSSEQGEALGRIRVPRFGLNAMLVSGTDHESLKKGPGVYRKDFLPGEGELIYVAGHRTTYLAPFAHIDSLRRGDSVRVEMPYGTFTYRVTGSRIVDDQDLAVLKSKGSELLVLQACHPRFFASHRYLVYAKPVSVELPGGRTLKLSPARAAALS